MKRTYQIGAVTFLFEDGDKPRVERSQSVGGSHSGVFDIEELHMMMDIEPMCQRNPGIPQLDKGESE